VRFSGVGAVTKIFENPYTIADAIEIPRAADLPLPLPAVNDIVVFNYFSEITSTISITVLA